jgi:VWFA-related protein
MGSDMRHARTVVLVLIATAWPHLVAAAENQTGFDGTIRLQYSAPAPTSATTGPGFHEAVDVAPITIKVRALDPKGRLIADLAPGDLQVWIDGEAVTVEGADWEAPGVPLTAGIPPEELAAAGVETPPSERLMVVYVQANMDHNRMLGMLQQLPRVTRLILDQAANANQVAIVSFDSHLRFRQDFTRDPQLLMPAIEAAIRHAGTEGEMRLEEPSLGRRFDRQAGKAATDPERGLELTATALGALPGPKALVFVGYGLGQLRGRNVQLSESYYRASDALAMARIPVYVVDVSEADAHSLEVGLKQVAADTGGAYARAYTSPDLAMRRLEGTLAGHYVVTVSRPLHVPPESLETGVPLKVALKGRKGRLIVAGG